MKGKHKNQRQDEILINFMRDHPEIANGFTKGKKVEYDALWDRLTAELNKNGPPKECSDWKKSWIDWKGNVRKKIGYKYSGSSRSDISAIRLTYPEEFIAQLCLQNDKMKIKCSTTPAKPMPPDRYEDEDVVDDISLMNLILGQDHSNNSSDSNNSSNSNTQRRTLKRKRETRQSQENLHDFLSSETSFQEDLRGFPSPSEDAHNSSSISISKTIDVISTATQTLGVKEGESSDCLKSISRALDDFCTIQAEKNKEMQRHHKAMEELQREKIMIKRRSLELQELKYKQEQDKLKRKTCIKCKGD